MNPPSGRSTVRFAPAAADDIDVAFAFVGERNRAAAESLLAALERTLERLANFPELGSPLAPDTYEFVVPGIRVVPVEPYLVFYRCADGAIVILRVLHARQDALGALFE